jgi:hypothetical protein
MVVRQHGDVDLKHNPNIAADEFKLLQLLQSVGVAAPRPYHLDQSGEIFSTPYLVIEYIEGKTEFAPSDVPDFILQRATRCSSSRYSRPPHGDPTRSRAATRRALAAVIFRSRPGGVRRGTASSPPAKKRLSTRATCTRSATRCGQSAELCSLAGLAEASANASGSPHLGCLHNGDATRQRLLYLMGVK